MRILILGGTIFVGRALVEEALKRGHEITLFNRGKHNPGLFPQVETIIGDRTEDLSPLAGKTWDAVIDTCGYLPSVVKKSAEFLSDAAGAYVFISSISVYSDFSKPGVDEKSVLGVLADPNVTEVNGETYGPLKVLCEQAAEAAMPGRVLTIRPGLIVGPHDPTDRFTYWPLRVAKGGEVLSPDRPDLPVQFIDVRDLAAWTLTMVESGVRGIFNADSPAGSITVGKVLDSCKRITESDAEFIWANEEFLLANEVAPWSELPLWVPESEGEGFALIACNKAFEAGLKCRPLDDTVRDTFAWASSRPDDYAMRAGLTPEKEISVLAKLKGTLQTRH